MSVRLRVPKGSDLPFALDRLPILFLAALAAVRSEAEFSLTELSRWVGKRKEKRWRPSQVAVRLWRLFECEIEVLGPDGMGPYKLAERAAIDPARDTVWVRFSQEFRRSAQDGVVLPLQDIRALTLHPFALEVYTRLRMILHDGIWARKWDLSKLIRAKGTPHHFSAALKSALALIRRVRPTMPFRQEGTQCVTCDYDAFRKHAHGVDADEERRALAAELAGMSWAEVQAHIQAQPVWRRQQLYMYAIDEEMRPAVLEQVARTGAVVARATETVRALDAQTDKLRAVRDEAEAAAAGLGAIDGSAAAADSEPVQERETAEPIDEPYQNAETVRCADATAGRPRPSGQPTEEASKRQGRIRRAREAIGKAAGRVVRTLAERSPPPPAPLQSARNAQVLTSEQSAKLAAAIGIIRRDRGRVGTLNAEEVATLKAGLDILGTAQPRPRPPIGQLRKVARRASTLVAGVRKPSMQAKRRGLLARLRRSGDDDPDG